MNSISGLLLPAKSRASTTIFNSSALVKGGTKDRFIWSPSMAYDGSIFNKSPWVDENCMFAPESSSDTVTSIEAFW